MVAIILWAHAFGTQILGNTYYKYISFQVHCPSVTCAGCLGPAS